MVTLQPPQSNRSRSRSQSWDDDEDLARAIAASLEGPDYSHFPFCTTCFLTSLEGMQGGCSTQLLSVMLTPKHICCRRSVWRQRITCDPASQH